MFKLKSFPILTLLILSVAIFIANGKEIDVADIANRALSHVDKVLEDRLMRGFSVPLKLRQNTPKITGVWVVTKIISI